jgi:hypothetical protein
MFRFSRLAQELGEIRAYRAIQVVSKSDTPRIEETLVGRCFSTFLGDPPI